MQGFRPNLSKHNAIPLLLSLAFVMLTACKQTATKPSEFISIFDGKTFTGWEGAKEFFRIEDASIVAGSLEKEIPKNQFLCTEESWEDFELHIKTKFTSKDNNAGIQIRSERIPNHHEVIGYQCDVGFLPDRPLWASIYDESRRNRFLIEPPASTIESLLKLNDFNEFNIRCEGPRIQIWFNGEAVVDYTETEEGIARSGIICVQIHSGTPAEAWYKDISIKAL